MNAAPQTQATSASLNDEFAALLPSYPADEARLALLLYQGLARGNPLAVASLADAMQQSVVQTKSLLANLDSVEYDEHGAITAYRGLTLRPTGHKVRVDGVTLYTWCAFDTLFLSGILRKPVEIDSSCPLTSQRISLTISGYQALHAKPQDTALSFVVPGAQCYAQDLRQSFCCYVHFFASTDIARDWISEYPNTMLLTLQEALNLAEKRNQTFFRHLMRPCASQHWYG